MLDLISMEKSHCYNPFVYLQNDNDVQKLVTNLFKSTTPKGSQAQDPFWDTSASMLLLALVFYSAKCTIRTIDKAAVASQRMKQAYITTKEKAERSVNANSSSAEEYASDKMERGIDEVVHDGAYVFDKAGRKGLETTKENYRTAKDGVEHFKQRRAEQSLRKQTSQNTSSAIKTLDKGEKTIKQSVSSAGNKSIKFAGRAFE